MDATQLLSSYFLVCVLGRQVQVDRDESIYGCETDGGKFSISYSELSQRFLFEKLSQTNDVATIERTATLCRYVSRTPVYSFAQGQLDWPGFGQGYISLGLMGVFPRMHATNSKADRSPQNNADVVLHWWYLKVVSCVEHVQRRYCP